jgi:preprotein translocase subunit SecG
VSKKDRKRKKKKGSRGKGGGRLSGMRSGMKSFVGTGSKKKESALSKIITYLLIAAAVGLLIYRFTR